MRRTVAAIILAVQFGFVVAARFHDARYFCWAPHDSQNEYGIRVWIGDEELSGGEVDDRYRLTTHGIDPRAISHVKYSIRQFERTYGKGDSTRVVLEYRTNGGPMEEWSWPES